MVRRTILTFLAAVPLAAAPAHSQEAAIKAGLSFSNFSVSGETPFRDRFVGTSIGGHVRFMFGPVGLQPELHMISRGAASKTPGNEERIRLEYIEIPVHLVLPFRAGPLEAWVFAGPYGAVEARCRSIVEEDGLKTNFGCEQSTGNVFDRRALDWGASGGAGVSHKLGSGRLILEGRHARGMRNIYDGEIEGVEIRNRSFVASIGYTINTRNID